MPPYWEHCGIAFEVHLAQIGRLIEMIHLLERDGLAGRWVVRRERTGVEPMAPVEFLQHVSRGGENNSMIPEARKG